MHVHQKLHQLLARVANIRKERLHAIHNIVDPERVKMMAIEPLPASMQMLRHKPFILGVGRLLNSQKGFDLLLRAHALTRSRGIDHNLLILGDGPDGGTLRQLAHSLNVEDSFFLPGFQRNPFPYFREARALAAPARLDGFGRIFLEATALGLPVICSPASGPAEILDHGSYGIEVPGEDIRALANAMGALITDQTLHSRYGGLSLERSNNYSPARGAVQWEKLLRTLTNAVEAPGRKGAAVALAAGRNRY